jgi:hypothetical protein
VVLYVMGEGCGTAATVMHRLLRSMLGSCCVKLTLEVDTGPRAHGAVDKKRFCLACHGSFAKAKKMKCLTFCRLRM